MTREEKEELLSKIWDMPKPKDDSNYWQGVDDVADLISNMPITEKGEWIIGVWDKCSVCGTEYSEDIYNISYESDYSPNFCPKCGADMRGKAE